MSVTFSPYLIFAVNPRSLPRNRTPERCLTCVAAGITGKHKTRVERPASDKHSYLFGSFIS